MDKLGLKMNSDKFLGPVKSGTIITIDKYDMNGSDSTLREPAGRQLW